jgi:hypothetical protein
MVSSVKKRIKGMTMELKKLKKQLVFQLTALLLTAVFVIVVGACPANDIFVVDRSALNTKITEAENAKTGVEVDTVATNVAQGSNWVSPEVMDALESAISAAKLTKNSIKQAKIDTAETDLNAAITVFNNAKKVGTKTSGFTLDQLIAKIADANAAKQGVVVDTAAVNVDAGTYWVTQAAMTALTNAISAAGQVRDATPNQTAIDSAVTTLSNAITTFTNALQAGAKTELNTSALTAKIAEANAAKAGIVIDTAATNVAKGTYWVTQAVITTFNTAISAAQTALGATTQAAVDEAVTVLNTAITTFNSAKTEGSKATIDYGVTLSWGTPFTPANLGLTPGNDTTELMLNWYSTGSQTGKVAKVRFIKGTRNAGTALIEVTGENPASATQANSGTSHKIKVTGLEPGASYQYSVCQDNTNWSPMYNFKVPSATGTWTFAVISDPQISQTTMDSSNRYDKSANSAAAWLATMEKVVARNVSFIVSCGDQVDSTATATATTEYTSFFAPAGLRSLPFAPVIGNHDTANSGNNIAHFRYFFNRPNDQSGSSQNINEYGNYYYRYNNILFVALNSSAYPTSRSGAATYITRFSNTIDAAKTAHAGKYDWLIVQHHKSTASVADHCGDDDLQYFVEAGFEKLMSDKNVDFVLAGHDHVYARSWPLQGLAEGKVSIPDKTAPGPNNTFTNPRNPIYLTFSTSSTIKYYSVSADKTYPYDPSLYTQYSKNNTSYPYLSADNAGTVTSAGATAYKAGNLPVSNAAFVQARIPSYAVVEVSNDLVGQKSITFKVYPIVTRSGQDSGASQSYSFNENDPFDTVTVTK